jgi:CubicO group peptidase (beta-lactamase class C family)
MEDLHEELLFHPAGLKQTDYSNDAQMPIQVLHAFSSDRGVYEDATFWNPSWTGDSGPLYSTVDEIARWARIHGRGELLSPEFQARLTARPAVAPPKGPYFAYGFIVSNGWYCQNPSFNGYSGGYAYNPERDIAIVVYTTDKPGPAKPGPAFAIVRQMVATIAPDQPLEF